MKDSELERLEEHRHRISVAGMVSLLGMPVMWEYAVEAAMLIAKRQLEPLAAHCERQQHKERPVTPRWKTPWHDDRQMRNICNAWMQGQYGANAMEQNAAKLMIFCLTAKHRPDTSEPPDEALRGLIWPAYSDALRHEQHRA